MELSNLKQQDPDVFALISKETERQNSEIELIASENYVSVAVLEALATPLANKYSEGYPGKRYYGGNNVIDELESLAISRAKKIFSAEHVNVQPLSGSPANAAVYMAFLNPGDKVLGLKLDHGGHLSHGHAVNFSGRLYNFIQYGVDPKTGLIDLAEVRRLALEHQPKMIVVGFSAYSREVDWQAFQDIADEVGAFSFADISHIAGLIAAGEAKNPVPIFDVVSTTTHKTLRGPRGAVIMCKEKYAAQVDRAVFPGMQGGPHDNLTAAKAVAFGEVLKPEFKQYSKQIILNAKAMANKFISEGYKIISGGTDNHLFIVDFSEKNFSGKDVEKKLEFAGISVSRSTIPNDPNPPANPSGIRIGTPAITTRGFKENEAVQLAELVIKAIEGDEHEGPKVKEEIRKLCEKFPINY